jgi:hypothetical protein
MAYFRGDCYLFDSGEHFHIWMRGGHDLWRESGWAEMGPTPELDSGVQVPVSTMDRFVLMRLAELLVERTATATLDAMAAELFSQPGNFGEDCLRQNRGVIRSALQDLEARCLPPNKEALGSLGGLAADPLGGPSLAQPPPEAKDWKKKDAWIGLLLVTVGSLMTWYAVLAYGNGVPLFFWGSGAVFGPLCFLLGTNWIVRSLRARQ